MMNYAPGPGQLRTRDEAIKAALHYPQRLNTAKTFSAVNAPFAPNAYRHENGQVMAGPDCTFAPGCQNISTQSLAIFERLGDVQTRVIAADERMGIVWLRRAWGVRERGGDQLTVWEMFKVYDGQIHAVEAFMRILPVERRTAGGSKGSGAAGSPVRAGRRERGSSAAQPARFARRAGVFRVRSQRAIRRAPRMAT
jgi:hypothetical protein